MIAVVTYTGRVLLDFSHTGMIALYGAIAAYFLMQWFAPVISSGEMRRAKMVLVIIVTLLLYNASYGATNAIVEESGTNLMVLGVEDEVATDSPLGRFFLGFGLGFGIWVTAVCVRIVRNGLFSRGGGE
jgi:hypothetical protein